MTWSIFASFVGYLVVIGLILALFKGGNPCPGIYQQLERYHRAEALGNPEIAELFKDYIERM